MKKYIIKTTMKGKDWKKFTNGVDWLDDETSYRLEWELEGFLTYLRGWLGLLTKCPHTFNKS